MLTSSRGQAEFSSEHTAHTQLARLYQRITWDPPPGPPRWQRGLMNGSAYSFNMQRSSLQIAANYLPQGVLSLPERREPRTLSNISQGRHEVKVVQNLLLICIYTFTGGLTTKKAVNEASACSTYDL